MLQELARSWVDDLAGKNRFSVRRDAFLKKEPRRILSYIHRHGGVGGLQRTLRAFFLSFAGQGIEIDVVCGEMLEPGPFSLENIEGVTLHSLEAFKKQGALPEYDIFYAVPIQFPHAYWRKLLRGFRGLKVLNWQQAADQVFQKNTLSFDVIHFESRHDSPSFLPGFVCPPPWLEKNKPASASPPWPQYYLTVFNPYDPVKGLHHLEKKLDHLDRPLVWCYDLSSFVRSARHVRDLEQQIARLHHPRLIPVPAPSQTYLERLYQHCDGYICFSEYESFGWAIADAIRYEKPVCGRQVGILRQVENFIPLSEDNPLPFNRITGAGENSPFLENLRAHLRGDTRLSHTRLQAERVAV